MKTMEAKGFYSILDYHKCLSDSFEYICYHPWVYGHYKYFHSSSAGIDFSRQILTTKVDPCAVRVKAFTTPIVVLNLFYQPFKSLEI